MDKNGVSKNVEQERGIFMKIRFWALLGLALLALAVLPASFAAAEEETAAVTALPYYGEFSGTVLSVTQNGGESGAVVVLLENAEGGQAVFTVDETTYMLTDNDIEEGLRATGYFLGSLPVALIYPPRYQAVMMAVDMPEGHFVKAARFDDQLVSDDNSLKLNIGEDTQIVLFDGTPAPAGLELGGLRLAVFYGPTTRSIPAITTPERIIVLALADAVPLTPPVVQQAANGMPLVVEGKLLTDAPPVIVWENGKVLVPLRAVAEALGYEVDWHAGRVSLDGKMVLTISVSAYTALDGTEILLETPPYLTDGRTYVPLNFFKEVLKVNNAYVFEGQLEINNEEIME